VALRVSARVMTVQQLHHVRITMGAYAVAGWRHTSCWLRCWHASFSEWLGCQHVVPASVEAQETAAS
jgi:hypothetical protein